MAEEEFTENHLPAKLKNLWLRAVTAAELRNYDFTISLLRTVVKEEPKFMEGRQLLRKAAILKKRAEKKKFLPTGGGISNMKAQSLIKKDPIDAMAQIEKSLEADPFNATGNQALYDAATAAGMTDVATFALETIREGHPENTRYLHQLAEHYLKIDDPEKAETIYNQITRKDTSDLDALKGAKEAAARSSMKKNTSEGGVFQVKDESERKELERESRTVLTDDQIHEELASLYEKYNEDQSNLNVVRRIGDLNERLSDWATALTYYDWAHQLSKGDSALERKVDMMRDKQRHQYVNDMEAYILENPDAADVDEKTAELTAFKKERSSTLINEAQERVERNPTDPQLRFELGSHLYDGGLYTEAIPHLQRSLNNPHIRIRAMLMLGRCYDRKNMYDLAKGMLLDASSELKIMDATKKEILYELGLIYDKMNLKEESIEQCFKVIYQADYDYRDVAKRVEDSYGS